MLRFIVTVKIVPPGDHDPHSKKTGRCPITFSRSRCSDQTGAHHSVLVQAESIEDAKRITRQHFAHVTRIEEVRDVLRDMEQPEVVA